MQRIRSLAPLIAVVIVLNMGSVQAAPQQKPAPPTMRLLHWAQMPIHVYLIPEEAATAERRALTLAGFDEWVRASHNAVGYQVVSAPALADLTVAFDPNSFLPGRKGATGSTTVLSTGDTITQGQIELAAGQDTPEELQSIAAHEFGHALGIEGHSDNSDDLMSPVEYRILPPRSATLEFPWGTSPLLSLPAHDVTKRDLLLLRACYPALFANLEKPSARLGPR